MTSSLLSVPMPPHIIEIVYAQLRANDENWISQLSTPDKPLHVDDWKQRELDRWNTSSIHQKLTTVGAAG